MDRAARRPSRARPSSGTRARGGSGCASGSRPRAASRARRTSRRVSAGSQRELRERRLGALEDRHAAARGRAASARRAARRPGASSSVVRKHCSASRSLSYVVDVSSTSSTASGVPGLVGERDPVARRRRVDGEADGQRPRQPVREAHLLDHALVVVLAHEALERRQRARGEHVQVGQLARGQRDRLQRVDAVRPVAGAVDERAAVRRDQMLGRSTALTRSPPRGRARAPRASRRRAARSPRASCCLGVDHELGCGRLLVRVVDAGEALDLAARTPSRTGPSRRGGRTPRPTPRRTPRRTCPTPRPSRAPCAASPRRARSPRRSRRRPGASAARRPSRSARCSCRGPPSRSRGPSRGACGRCRRRGTRRRARGGRAPARRGARSSTCRRPRGR